MFVIAIATMFHAPIELSPPFPDHHPINGRPAKKVNNRIPFGSCHSLGPCDDWQEFWMKGIGKTNTCSMGCNPRLGGLQSPVKGCSITFIVAGRSLGGQKSIALQVFSLHFA